MESTDYKKAYGKLPHNRKSKNIQNHRAGSQFNHEIRSS